MPTKTLVKRVTIDGEELVAISPWYYEGQIKVMLEGAERIETLEKRIAKLEAILEARGQ